MERDRRHLSPQRSDSHPYIQRTKELQQSSCLGHGSRRRRICPGKLSRIIHPPESKIKCQLAQIGSENFSRVMGKQRRLFMLGPETIAHTGGNTSEFSACVSVEPVPALSINRMSGQQVSFSWTNTATGYVLKQSTNLAPPVLWTAVTNVASEINGQFVVVLPVAKDNRFYLLEFE